MKNENVRARVDVRDNGRLHKAGEVFEMESSLVDAHVKAGQVERIEEVQQA